MSKNLDQTPALTLADWAAFDDTNLVTNGGFALLIMRIEFLRALNDFLEFRVWYTCGVFHDDGLLHLVGNNEAHAGLTESTGLFRGL